MTKPLKPFESLTIHSDEGELLQELERFLLDISTLQFDAVCWPQNKSLRGQIGWIYCGKIAEICSNDNTLSRLSSAWVTIDADDNYPTVSLQSNHREIHLTLSVSDHKWLSGPEACDYVTNAARSVISYAEAAPAGRSAYGQFRGINPEPWVLAAQMLSDRDESTRARTQLVHLPSSWESLQVLDSIDRRLRMDSADYAAFNLHSPIFCTASLDDQSSSADCIYIDIGSSFSVNEIFEQWVGNPLAKIRSISAAYQTGMLESIRSQN